MSAKKFQKILFISIAAVAIAGCGKRASIVAHAAQPISAAPVAGAEASLSVSGTSLSVFDDGSGANISTTATLGSAVANLALVIDSNKESSSTSSANNVNFTIQGQCTQSSCTEFVVLVTSKTSSGSQSQIAVLYGYNTADPTNLIMKHQEINQGYTSTGEFMGAAAPYANGGETIP